ncbi:MAG: molybdopterin-dependent oxidoreductase [Rhodospirillaceae bacterium]|nr:molybdopterin-dependent oxidoreductase [Rhodospirillaceae bacterium]MBT7356288.1 molybdopterin-dependent oxidoreductase [Rhodospirillaceae bacterium]
MKKLNRRNFMTLAGASGAAIAAGVGKPRKALAGTVTFKNGGRDFSPITGKERKAIPTACWGCVTRDSMIGYVEDGRLKKLEGHPESIRTLGKLCAKGQAGINQVYFPDRILYPLQRVGKRGEHKWKRISWDEALDIIASKLKPLRDAGTPEQFMYAYGRHKASQWAVTGDFLAAYGTKTIGNHTSVCEAAKWVGQESLWGGMYDNWDYDKTDFVVNFGSNNFETHTNHIPTSQRLIRAVVDRGVPLYTFDVRLSNTAAKSTEWVPINPGYDGLVMLSMINVIMNEGLFRKDHFKYMRVTPDHHATTAQKIAAVKKQVAKFTPEFAAKKSGVPASKIKEIARGFAKAKSACLVTYRGTVMHYHGADQERAAMLLAAITNNLDTAGGRVMGVGGSWNAPSSKPAKVSKGLHIKDGFPGEAAYPTHHVSQSIIPMIIDGSHGRPSVYWWSCYNPTYINGNNKEAAKAFQDETIFPFLITTTIAYDESSQYADIILPDVTYLERWDWEDMVDASQIGENYIRQPLVKPLGESRCQGDVWPELAKRLGFDLVYSSKKDFVKQTCDMTPGVKEAGGFDYMVKHGVWHDKNAKPNYGFYEAKVDVSGDGVILDKKTGVYWNHKKAGVSAAEAKSKGYLGVSGAKSAYVAQDIEGTPRKAYPPNTKFVKSGLLDFYSDNFVKKGLPAFPTYTPTPEHEAMGKDDIILTTYKVAVHTHSRTTQCKWLSEIKHDNPGWINTKTATERGIKDGDKIKVKSDVGEITTTAYVTEGIVPGIIAISHHFGRKFSGIYGSGKNNPMNAGGSSDPDVKNMTWKTHGVHPNAVIPNSSDPISGTQRWMDTVVKVSKA